MNNFFFNKYINQQHGNTYKKLQHGTRQLGAYKGIRVIGPHAPADDVEGGKRYGSKDDIACHEGSYIIGRILAVQEKYKTCEQKGSNND